MNGRPRRSLWARLPPGTQSIMAEAPARVIRQGIVWTRQRQAKIDHG